MPDTMRLRPHPEGRFAQPVQHFDLASTAVALRNEPHRPIGGHRQIAVFRQGPLELLVFDFEANSMLKDHRTEGVVAIQALSGRLRVAANDTDYELEAGQVLALAPNVQHSVHAVAPSTMLLTVAKEPAGTAPPAA